MLAIVSRAPLLIRLVATPLAAEVVRIEVHSRAAGKNLLRVDPTLPANRIVTDIDKAPRNANGKGTPKRRCDSLSGT
jgi:hypothetical protein